MMSIYVKGWCCETALLNSKFNINHNEF